MANTLKIKRGLASGIPQGQLAEPLFTTDTYDLYIGKGSGGNQRIQKYIASGTSSQFLKGDGSLDSNTYEPLITAGTTLQYWRGDKSWRTLDTSVVPENGPIYFTEPRVLATVLTGLNLTGGGSIAATDSVLQAFGKLQNQVSAVGTGVTYIGTWNANTNSPTITSGVGTKGYYYVVNVAGSTNIDGITDWNVGDWIIFNGTVWDQVDNTDAVSSVNGFTGAVNLGLGDISNVVLTSPTNGQILQFNGTTSKWINSNYTYTGTVTSVGLSMPSIFTVTNSPVTTSGTLTATLANQNANIVFAGPSTGSAAAPTFRSLVAADIPSLPYEPTLTKGNLTEATSSVLTITGGSGAVIGSGTSIQVKQASGTVSGYLSSGDWTTFNNKQNALTNPVTGTGTNNQIAYFNSTGSTIASLSTATYPSLTELTYVKGVTSAIQTQLDAKQAAISLTTTGSSGASTFTSNTLNVPNYTFNGLSPMTTLGDIIYGGASGAGTRLAGNITTTRKFLRQVGDAINSAAPAWDTLVSGDIPNNAANTTGSAATLTTARTLTIGATGKTFNGSADVTWTLGEIGAQAVLTNPVTGTGTSGQITYFNGTSSITSSSTFTFSPTGQFTVNNAAAAGSIGMDVTSVVSATANNDILYGLRIYPTFSLGSFTGVTQRALGVFGNVYINGSITSGSISGTSATFTSSVTGSYYSINNGTFRGGLYPYSAVLGSGTDHSPTVFGDTGNGIYFAVNGSATKVLTLASSGAASFSSSVTTLAGGQAFYSAPSTGTNGSYLQFNNNGSGTVIIGQESSVAGTTVTNSTAYSALIGTTSGTRDLILFSGGTARLTIASTGAATFSGAVGVNGATPVAELQVGKASDVTIAMSNSTSVITGNRGTLAWYNSSNSSVAAIRAVAVTDNVGSDLEFYTRPAAGSLTKVLTLASTGAATFSSSVTAGTDGVFGNNRTGNDAGATVLNILGSSSTSTSAQLNLTQVWNGLQYPVILRNTYNNLGGGAASSIFTISTTQYVGSAPLTTERLRIDGNTGNVGINTSSPSEIFHVYTSSKTVTSRNGVNLQTSDAAAADIGLPLMWSSNGSISNYATASIAGRRESATSTNYSGYLQFATCDSSGSLTERMRITSGGEVWIGYTVDQGAYALQVNGSVIATSYFESSDIRLKNILSTKASDNFSAIEFNWKDNRDDKKHWGYAAQDVLKFIPDAVQVNNDGMMTVNYNEAHTWKIAMLEAKIKELESKLN